MDSGGHLKESLLVEWDRFAPGGQRLQFARKFDHLLSRGLDNLTFEAGTEALLKQLAVRNLLRGYSLSIPTGQAISTAMGLEPLPPELMPEDSKKLRDALDSHDFKTRTPLWFYLLREATVHGKGQHLGAVGSRLVAETLIGFMKCDPNSYLNSRHDPAVRADGIDCTGTPVKGISDMLQMGGVL